MYIIFVFLTQLEFLIVACSYPKDSDKVMLAKQTGLTRSQVQSIPYIDICTFIGDNNM